MNSNLVSIFSVGSSCYIRDVSNFREYIPHVLFDDGWQESPHVALDLIFQLFLKHIGRTPHIDVYINFSKKYFDVEI